MLKQQWYLDMSLRRFQLSCVTKSRLRVQVEKKRLDYLQDQSKISELMISWLKLSSSRWIGLQAHLGGGPGLSLLQSPPDHHLVMVVAQGYMFPGPGAMVIWSFLLSFHHRVYSYILKHWEKKQSLYIMITLYYIQYKYIYIIHII